MSIEQGYKSIYPVTVTSDEYNQNVNLARSVLNKANTATLVQVVKVNSTDKQVSVKPLVTMVDGYGQPVQHNIVHGIPYIQLQWGSSAIIATPAVNDIGLCIFCQQDISNVKKNKTESLPASFRRFDYADGIYIGGVLNASPDQYIEFLPSGGINIVSSGDVNIISGKLNHNGVDVGDTSTHSGVQPGTGNTGFPN
jgi:hypothetical protein